MCGIAGFAGEGDRDLARSRISRMLRELWRRGPDDSRIATWSNAVLGSRRLAVFDPREAGNQPMVSADRKVGLVFNGAIYNFRALRAQLIGLGCAFRSETDTEVILNGYLEWGLDRLVAKLDGMFAFALWDAGSRSLFLVRDRLGVKPLVHSIGREGLYFASTVSALAVADVVDRQAIDPESVLDFLRFGFVPDERTIYEGACKVGAGTIAEWSGGELSVRRFWEPSFSPGSSMGFYEAVEETERLLLKATEKRLNADVPVGALLSGGIDSGLVCWAASHLGADLPTFTLGVEGSPSDEAAAALRTAKTLRLHNVLVPYTPLKGEMEDLVSAYGEPFACSSSLGMLRLCETAARSVTVLLTGEGGDEAFLGYPAYLRYRTSERLAGVLPAMSQQLWSGARTLVPDWGVFRRLSHMVDYAAGGATGVAESQDLLPWFLKNGIVGDRLRARALQRGASVWPAESGRDLIRDFQFWHFRNRFLGEYMTKVDGSSMYHSLEARSPFLDVPLWNLGNDLQVDVRLAGGESKAILRAIARRRIHPEIGSRQKRGFTVPAGDWLASGQNSWLQDVFENPAIVKEGWAVGAGIEKAVKRARRQGKAGLELWHLFVLEKWFRHIRTGGNEDLRPEEAIPEICCTLSQN